MKRQKIERYRFSVTQNTRRKKSPEPLKSAGVVLVCLYLLAGAAFGCYKMMEQGCGVAGEKACTAICFAGHWHTRGSLYEIDHSLYYFGSNHF